jgi:lactoylglutathione lyase
MGLTVDNVDAACAELKAKGADVAIGPLTRSPGLRLAFIRAISLQEASRARR